MVEAVDEDAISKTSGVNDGFTGAGANDRPGCPQEDDQLLREGWQWKDPRRRHDSRYTF